MYLIDAKKSNLMGHLQPRSYLTLHKPNYSIHNNRDSYFSKNGNYIKTTYRKVRLVIERNKPLRIDCCDFRFSESYGSFMVVGGNGTEFIICDVVPFACAYNVGH